MRLPQACLRLVITATIYLPTLTWFAAWDEQDFRDHERGLSPALVFQMIFLCFCSVRLTSAICCPKVDDIGAISNVLGFDLSVCVYISRLFHPLDHWEPLGAGDDVITWHIVLTTSHLHTSWRHAAHGRTRENLMLWSDTIRLDNVDYPWTRACLIRRWWVPSQGRPLYPNSGANLKSYG